MTTTAHLRNLRMSPRKLRLLVDLVRGQGASQAVTQLQFSHKIAAKPLVKLIQSAMANAAHNHNLDPESLRIREAYVNAGSIMYRFTLARWDVPRRFENAQRILLWFWKEWWQKGKAKKKKTEEKKKKVMKTEIRNPKSERNSKFKNLNLFRISIFEFRDYQLYGSQSPSKNSPHASHLYLGFPVVFQTQLCAVCPG